MSITNVPYINGFRTEVLTGVVAVHTFLGGSDLYQPVANLSSMTMTPSDALELGRVLLQTGLAAMRDNRGEGNHDEFMKAKLAKITDQIWRDLHPKSADPDTTKDEGEN